MVRLPTVKKFDTFSCFDTTPACDGQPCTETYRRTDRRLATAMHIRIERQKRAGDIGFCPKLFCGSATAEKRICNALDCKSST